MTAQMITQAEIDRGAALHEMGFAWSAIGRHLGRSGVGMRTAVERGTARRFWGAYPAQAARVARMRPMIEAGCTIREIAEAFTTERSMVYGDIRAAGLWDLWHSAQWSRLYTEATE